MARIMSQTLIRETQSPLMASRLISLRLRSKRPEKAAELTELDLGSSDESGPGPDIGMRRLQDAIHAIVIRRAAPDWIPFVPGSSYWIPPAPKKRSPLTMEEELSFSSAAGWPSFSYFVEGVLPHKVDDSKVKPSDSSEKGHPEVP